MARHIRVRGAVAIAAVLALGTTLSVPAASATGRHVDPGHDTVAVQTYNMDGAGDLSPLFDPRLDLITATSMIWADIAKSDIPVRAQGVARSIARMQPDLVGLQEAAVWSLAPAVPTSPTTVAPTGPFVVQYDSLGTLLSSLRRLGSPYRVVVKNKTFGNEAFPLPAMTAGGLSLATFVDYNVILVREKSLRHGLVVRNAQSHIYQASLPMSVAGQSIAVTRGWAQTDVRVGHEWFRFVDTHLEAFGTPPIKDDARNPQAMELAALVGSWAHRLPVIVVGDINARPTMCTSIPRSDPFEHVLDQNVVAYRILTRAGLTEVWPALHPKAPCAPRSWTSGSRALDDPKGLLTHRIDDVFFTHGVDPLRVRIVGTRTAEMTGGLWPSDHASTWSLLRI